MGNIDASYNSEIFRYNQPLIIATNRASAKLMGVRLKYQSGGYAAGTILARNSVDGLYQAYNSGGSSGTDVAKAILFMPRAAEDFDGTAATSTTVSQAIIGGCTVYKDRLSSNYDSDVLTDLGAKLFIDASGTELLSF